MMRLELEFPLEFTPAESEQVQQILEDALEEYIKATFGSNRASIALRIKRAVSSMKMLIMANR